MTLSENQLAVAMRGYYSAHGPTRGEQFKGVMRDLLQARMATAPVCSHGAFLVAYYFGEEVSKMQCRILLRSVQPAETPRPFTVARRNEAMAGYLEALPGQLTKKAAALIVPLVTALIQLTDDNARDFGRRLFEEHTGGYLTDLVGVPRFKVKHGRVKVASLTFDSEADGAD